MPPVVPDRYRASFWWCVQGRGPGQLAWSHSEKWPTKLTIQPAGKAGKQAGRQTDRKAAMQNPSAGLSYSTPRQSRCLAPTKGYSAAPPLLGLGVERGARGCEVSIAAGAQGTATTLCIGHPWLRTASWLWKGRWPLAEHGRSVGAGCAVGQPAPLCCRPVT